MRLPWGTRASPPHRPPTLRCPSCNRHPLDCCTSCPCVKQVVYPHWLARLLHNAPLAALVLLGALAPAAAAPLGSMLLHALLALVSVACGLALPALAGAVRANYSREWRRGTAWYCVVLLG